MSKIDNWIDNKIAQNIFAWSCVVFILLGMNTSSEGDKLKEVFKIILIIGSAVYINNYLILPYFKEKTLRFISFSLLNILSFSLLALFVFMNGELRFQKFSNLFAIIFLGISFGTAIRIARDSFRHRQEEKEAELKLLKAQLNPHFLFNTLNNLYGLSVLKSDKLPDLMLQLSDLLRYSLYETKDIFVPLEKEMSYLQNYISLEEIRLQTKTTINFSVKGNTIGKQIAPMLLIVFVENSFKYLSKEKESKNSVSITIEVLENKLFFNCKNTYDAPQIKEEDLEKGKSGIGLVNAKKRLGLIYPEAHNLSIRKENNLFEVALNLNI